MTKQNNLRPVSLAQVIFGFTCVYPGAGNRAVTEFASRDGAIAIMHLCYFHPEGLLRRSDPN
jgi:hypothetical protein